MDNSLQIVNTNREMQEWANKIRACRSRSISVRAWCRENNVPISSFYAWDWVKRIPSCNGIKNN